VAIVDVDRPEEGAGRGEMEDPALAAAEDHKEIAALSRKGQDHVPEGVVGRVAGKAGLDAFPARPAGPVEDMDDRLPFPLSARIPGDEDRSVGQGMDLVRQERNGERPGRPAVAVEDLHS
jgi:hypothetical protein